MAPVLALDVGGTKIAAGVVGEDGSVLSAERVATPARGTAEGMWAAITGVMDAARVAAGSPAISGVGIGCGGPMDWPAGEVSPVNIPAWRGFPLRERVRALHPGVPVRIHNDAICVAIAEHWSGAGRGISSMLGMVVSTGVGGGVISGGRVIDGATGNAGHVGHVVVDPTGPPCGCGGRGCLEAIARGPAMAAWATGRGWVPSDGDASARSLADDAARGHPIATRAYRRAGAAVGVAIASVAAVLDLELVVVGGGVAEAGDLLFDPLREELARHARLGFTRDLPVMAPAVGRHAGLIGAAALVLAGERYWSPGD